MQVWIILLKNHVINVLTFYDEESIREDVLNWISCSDTLGSSHNSGCKQRQEGTGNWFIHGKT